MAVYSKEMLSSATDGQLVDLVATASPGTLIHTVTTATLSKDEIYLWCANRATASDFLLTLEWGGTDVTRQIKQIIPAQDGLHQIQPGMILAGTTATQVIRAFGTGTDLLLVGGFVNRITATA